MARSAGPWRAVRGGCWRTCCRAASPTSIQASFRSRDTITASGKDLFGAVGAIAGVAEAGQDVGGVVQSLVDRGQPDRNVRVEAAHALDAFGCCDQRYQPYLV